MASGRRHHGRSSHLNRGHVTRAAAKVLAFESPGRGAWQREHERKTEFPLYCRALLEERAQFRTPLAGDVNRSRRQVYVCRYGSHWLIETARSHWHIGRATTGVAR